MSTITMHATTIATPEQYTAALTDFGPSRVKAVEARNYSAQASQP